MNTNKVIAEKIASEYAVKEENKLVALKKLDAKAKRPANIFAYTFGIIMALVLGVGMCLAMGQIGDGSNISMAIGIVVGLCGIGGVSTNYPIYKKILNVSKRKYANDIMLLAKEVVEEEK
ncbi:MAG: dihydropteridine reductase [Bacilli bacterium]